MCISFLLHFSLSFYYRTDVPVHSIFPKTVQRCCYSRFLLGLHFFTQLFLQEFSFHTDERRAAEQQILSNGWKSYERASGFQPKLSMGRIDIFITFNAIKCAAIHIATQLKYSRHSSAIVVISIPSNFIRKIKRFFVHYLAEEHFQVC